MLCFRLPALRRRGLMLVVSLCCVAAWSSTWAAAADRLTLLIVDGQNNHANWPETTQIMKQALEESGLFTVDVVTHAPQGPDASFAPDFKAYDVVLSNFGHAAALWSEATRAAFETYVREGGGFVVVHAADNSFPEWPAYNEMIGLGGWGGRNEQSGPLVYYNADGQLVRDTSPGPGGSHGPQTPFAIVVRDPDHPITSGMPTLWMHATDELYNSLRGPATNMDVLATAFAPETNRHEPMLLTIRYGKGRVFHTPMGHGNESQQCVGFLTCLIRGCEWAATGEVTAPIPDDFPTADEVRLREP